MDGSRIAAPTAHSATQKAHRLKKKKRAPPSDEDNSEKRVKQKAGTVLHFQDVFSDVASADDAADKMFELANATRVVFPVGEHHELTIGQDPSVVGTGGCVWDTAYVLARWVPPRLATLRSKLKGKDRRLRCLEVGAGCGLLGLALAHLGCDVLVTEQASAMANLRANLEANPPPASTGGMIDAAPMCWTDARDVASTSARGPWDVIVGTDVVYAIDPVVPLLTTLHACASPRSEVWLCLQQREPEATAKLLAIAPSYFRDVRRIDLEDDGQLPFAVGAECFLVKLRKPTKQNAPEPKPIKQAATEREPITQAATDEDGQQPPFTRVHIEDRRGRAAEHTTNAPAAPSSVSASLRIRIGGSGVATSSALHPRLVEAEIARRESFRNLRHAFVQRCRHVRPAKGAVLSCFTKWHFELLRRAALAPAASPSASGEACDNDPILPANVTAAADVNALAAVLVSELVDDGFTYRDSTALAAWLHAELLPAATKLAKRVTKLRRGSVPNGGYAGRVGVRPGGKPGVTDLSLGDVTLQLADARLAALRQDFQRTIGLQTTDECAPSDVDAFHRAVLAMCLRYQSLDGGASHAASPTQG